MKLVVLADELGDEAVDRTLVELIWRGELLHDAVVEHRDPVRHRQRLALVVGDVDDRDPEVFVQVLDLELHVLAQLLVERAERLIHQHERRIEDERARERDALLLAARKLRRTSGGEGPHLHHVERARDLGLALGLAHPAHLERKGEILGHRHVRKEGVVLEHHPDAALVRRHEVDRAAVEADLAVRRRLEACEHHQAGGLARARRPEHGQELALRNREVQVLHHEADAVVAFLNPVELNEGPIFSVARHQCFPVCRAPTLAAGRQI